MCVRHGVQIDTQDVLFICGGAFAGLEHTINNRVCTASIGFGAVVRGKNALDSQKSQGDTYDKVEPTDLVGYGTSPSQAGLTSPRGVCTPSHCPPPPMPVSPRYMLCVW